MSIYRARLRNTSNALKCKKTNTNRYLEKYKIKKLKTTTTKNNETRTSDMH